MSFSTTSKRLVRISLLVPCLLLLQPKQARASSEIMEIAYYSILSTFVSVAIINFCFYTGIYADPDCCAECKKPLDENNDVNNNDSSLKKMEV